jgi:hypothetical protein
MKAPKKNAVIDRLVWLYLTIENEGLSEKQILARLAAIIKTMRAQENKKNANNGGL